MTLTRRISRKTRAAASPFLLLALILSHTQVVVQAQKAAVGSLPTAATSKEIADAVSKAFGAAVDNATGHMGGTGAKPAGTADTASGTSTRAASGNMAQSAAGTATAGLKLMDAYQELLNSVQLSDIGDGTNLAQLQAASVKLQEAFAAVSGVLGPDAVTTGLQRFIGMEQLLLQTVGTQLGDLGLVAGLLALAAFILVAVAGGLAAGAGGIFIAINSQGLAAARASSTAAAGDGSVGEIRSDTDNNTGTDNSTGSSNSSGSNWWDSPWFKETESKVDEASMHIINWAFNNTNNPIDLALGIMDAAHSLVAPAAAS